MVGARVGDSVGVGLGVAVGVGVAVSVGVDVGVAVGVTVGVGVGRMIRKVTAACESKGTGICRVKNRTSAMYVPVGAVSGTVQTKSPVIGLWVPSAGKSCLKSTFSTGSYREKE
jgi:hypothetical protein